ncbi:acyloxyacyl hydrolase [Wenzhouxiangella sp. XN201]|uniref:acyloxyacyl hydrolase n=1 Tax=Wenzhouxiangella sp. XN201 TaxID=2710755 RepID=UPI0013C715AF|nr:acyloxyacyl hydrolase [Wenzhouxiangella sp. XN201]NEZ04161.1 acyloxyacyl hydrolase [Wenzhouxiangella sp. XN201]
MHIRLISILVLTASLAFPLRAAELMLAPGITSEGETTANISLAFDWNQRWFESETGHLGGYWNVAYTWWEAGRFGSDEHSVSFSPVLIYRFNTDGWQPFVEGGIGAAYFSDDHVGDRRLGSQAQFEDRFAVGVQLSERDALRLRVIHYSNAGLEDPNQGINSWSIVYSRKF